MTDTNKRSFVDSGDFLSPFLAFEDTDRIKVNFKQGVLLCFLVYLSRSQKCFRVSCSCCLTLCNARGRKCCCAISLPFIRVMKKWGIVIAALAEGKSSYEANISGVPPLLVLRETFAI